MKTFIYKVPSSVTELLIILPNNELDVPVELGDVHCTWDKF